MRSDRLNRPLVHELSPLGVGDKLGREGVPHLAEVAQAANSVADLAEQLGQVRQTVLVQAANVVPGPDYYLRRSYVGQGALILLLLLSFI